MKRNRIEEKQKEEDRLYDYYTNLDTNLVWEPVEEPQFLGWELQVVLGDSGSRRRDAEDILYIMQIMGVNKPVFTRHRWVTRIVKGAGGNYIRALEEYKRACDKKSRWGLWWTDSNIGHYFPYYFDKNISETTYEALPGHLKKYFGKYEEPETYWRPSYNYYKLSLWGGFPFYELRIKVTRAYSTHRGIPQSFNESESRKLRDKFINSNYYERRFDNHRDDWSARVSKAEDRRRTHIVFKSVSKKIFTDTNLDELESLERRMYRRR